MQNTYIKYKMVILTQPVLFKKIEHKNLLWKVKKIISTTNFKKSVCDGQVKKPKIWNLSLIMKCIKTKNLNNFNLIQQWLITSCLVCSILSAFNKNPINVREMSFDTLLATLTFMIPFLYWTQNYCIYHWTFWSI